MEDKYLHYIRRFERKEERDSVFPEENLGIGDRMLYNKIIRNQAKIFFDNTGRHQIHTALLLAINQDLERFEFKPRKIKGE